MWCCGKQITKIITPMIIINTYYYYMYCSTQCSNSIRYYTNKQYDNALLSLHASMDIPQCLIVEFNNVKFFLHFMFNFFSWGLGDFVSKPTNSNLERNHTNHLSNFNRYISKNYWGWNLQNRTMWHRKRSVEMIW